MQSFILQYINPHSTLPFSMQSCLSAQTQRWRVVQHSSIPRCSSGILVQLTRWWWFWWCFWSYGESHITENRNTIPKIDWGTAMQRQMLLQCRSNIVKASGEANKVRQHWLFSQIHHVHSDSKLNGESRTTKDCNPMPKIDWRTAMQSQWYAL